MNKIDINKEIQKWNPLMEKLNVPAEKRAFVASVAATENDVRNAARVLNENVSYGNVYNTDGMGAVVNPSLSGIPGIPNLNPASIGSGDIQQALMPGSMKIAATAIGLELVPTVQVKSNKVTQVYWDFTYGDHKSFSTPERNIRFKARVSDAFKTAMRTFLADIMVTETRGGLSRDLYFSIAGTASTANVFVAPTGSKTNLVIFKGFARITDEAIFEIYEQDNVASDATQNTLAYNANLSAVLAAASLSGGYFAPGNVTTTPDIAFDEPLEVTMISEVSLNEDFLRGATTNNFTDATGKSTAMPREMWDAGRAPKIGPNMYTADITIGVAHVRADIRLSELDDYKIQFGVDIVERTKAQLINQLAQQISTEIVAKVKEMGDRNRAVTADNTANASYKQFDFVSNGFLGASGLGGESTLTIARYLWRMILQGCFYIQNDGRIGTADYIVTNIKFASALMSVAGNTLNPIPNVKVANGQLYPIGTVDGIKIYVDPYMGYNDYSIYLGRVGTVEEPGIKFFSYLLAGSVNIVPEGHMGQAMYMYSRYAVAEYGFFPEKQYLTIKVHPEIAAVL